MALTHSVMRYIYVWPKITNNLTISHWSQIYIYILNPYECVRLYELKIFHYMPWAYSKNLVHWLHPHVEPKQFSLYQSQLNPSMITNADRITWHRLIMKCVAWKSREGGLYTYIFIWSYFTSMRSFNNLNVQSVTTE